MPPSLDSNFHFCAETLAPEVVTKKWKLLQQWSCSKGHVLLSVWGHCAVADHDDLFNTRSHGSSISSFTTDLVVVLEEPALEL